MNKINNEKLKKEIKKIKNNIKCIKKENNKAKIKNYVYEEAKMFDIIYLKYGQKIYKKYVPFKYRHANMENLLECGRFLEAYIKHGKSACYIYDAYIKKCDIYYETGSKIKSSICSLKINLKRIIEVILASVIFVSSTFVADITNEINKIKKIEIKKYGRNIDEYLDDIKEYSEKIKSYNLTDLQIIMKIMDDMWNNINGYGKPNIDLVSYPGLDLATEDATGVCRNMTDDMARKLNAINKKYKAESIIVYLDERACYEMANINRKNVQNRRR